MDKAEAGKMLAEANIAANQIAKMPWSPRRTFKSTYNCNVNTESSRISFSLRQRRRCYWFFNFSRTD